MGTKKDKLYFSRKGAKYAKGTMVKRKEEEISHGYTRIKHG